MQLVQFDELQRLPQLLQLQPMEILGPTTRFRQQDLHGAWSDLADVRCCLDRTTMHQALDDPNHRLLG
jgi:hypothetical protein